MAIFIIEGDHHLLPSGRDDTPGTYFCNRQLIRYIGEKTHSACKQISHKDVISPKYKQIDDTKSQTHFIAHGILKTCCMFVANIKH